MNATPRAATGMALMSAIFLIAVLVALGLAMATMSTGSQDTATKSLQAAKVYYGAKAGLEWAIQQAVAAGSCPGGASNFGLTQGGLSGVNVSVTCVQQSGHGAGNFVYYLTSTATIGTLGGLDYAERRVEATVSNIP